MAKMAGKGIMGEATEISVGSDWCTLKVARHCHGGPDKCVLLGDKVRACRACLRELIEEEYAEEFEWTLKETWHEGKCKTVSVEFDDSREEVTFCPKCLLRVMLRHDPEALDWVLIFHSKSHTGLKAGIWQGLSFPQAACRECLLIALYQVDPNFFRMLTKQGEDLIESIIPGALAWRRD